MPNWTNNTLIIEKATDEQIECIISAAKADRLLGEFFKEPDWRQIPNENGHLPGPPRARWIKGSTGPARNWVDGSRFPNGQYDQRWYGWRTQPEHWMTKWEPQDIHIDVEGGQVTLIFDTAWCQPGPAWFEKLSGAMPNAEVRHFFNEPGMDFYGVTLCSNGNAVQLSRDVEPLRETFIENNADPDELVIYRDEDHEDHDAACENLLEQWWENEDEILDEAQGRLLEDAALMIEDLQSTATAGQ